MEVMNKKVRGAHSHTPTLTLTQSYGMNALTSGKNCLTELENWLDHACLLRLYVKKECWQEDVGSGR